MAKDSKGDHPLIHRLPVKDRTGKVVAEKEVAAYRGLLHLAHDQGLRFVRTELLQYPSADNGHTTIVRAVVRTGKGTFTGIGDASPSNVNPKVAPHAIRMAETRAEARAFRKALDIGVVALEELDADLEDGITYEGAILPKGAPRPWSPRSESTQPPASDEATAPSNGEGGSRPAGWGGGDFRASDAQRKFLFRLVHDAGFVGDAAREFLHKELGVSSVKEASKGAVSALIDRLKSGELRGDNGQGNGHAPAAE